MTVLERIQGKYFHRPTAPADEDGYYDVGASMTCSSCRSIGLDSEIESAGSHIKVAKPLWSEAG